MSGGGAADRPGPVRPGEELPVAPLAAWLHTHLPRSAGDAPAVTVEQFPGGHSNLTYLVRDGERELILRRPPIGSSVKTAHDMGREHRVLSRLQQHYTKAPRALAACDDPAVIGAPFFIMERVRGVILRSRAQLGPQTAPPPEQTPLPTISPSSIAAPGIAPSGIASPGTALPGVAQPGAAPPDLGPPPALPPWRALSEATVDALAELHAVDVAAAGLADLGRPAGYAGRQVAGWSERWQRSATEPVPEIAAAAAWLAEHLPRRAPEAEEAGAALLHNDFKLDNLVLAADLGGIVAVLDWEMATVGDPLMDLGTSLGYWLDPDDGEALRLLPVGLTAQPGNLSRAEVVERYARASRRDVSQILFYYVFGLLKIAVIAQQIYYRYRRGLTHDERFAALGGSVRLLGRTAAQAISRRRIERLWG